MWTISTTVHSKKTAQYILYILYPDCQAEKNWWKQIEGLQSHR